MTMAAPTNATTATAVTNCPGSGMMPRAKKIPLAALLPNETEHQVRDQPIPSGLHHEADQPAGQESHENPRHEHFEIHHAPRSPLPRRDRPPASLDVSLDVIISHDISYMSSRIYVLMEHRGRLMRRPGRVTAGELRRNKEINGLGSGGGRAVLNGRIGGSEEGGGAIQRRGESERMGSVPDKRDHECRVSASFARRRQCRNG